MQDSRAASTLELVVNEQQLQNMSQIDLSRSPDGRPQQRQSQPQQQARDMFSFEELKRWPTRFRESFGAKLNEAKSKSETRTEYVIQVVQAFSGTLLWVLCFLFTIIVPAFLFFIGLSTLDDCTDRPALPYLILAIGFVMSASNLFNLALALDLPILTNHKLLSSDVKNTIASMLNIIFNCVVAFLYILSAYMAFSIGKRVQPESTEGEPPPIDCNGTLYHSAFWFITLTLSSLVILSLMAIIFFAYNKYRLAIIRGSMPRSQSNAANMSPQPNSNNASTIN